MVAAAAKTASALKRAAAADERKAEAKMHREMMNDIECELAALDSDEETESDATPVEASPPPRKRARKAKPVRVKKLVFDEPKPAVQPAFEFGKVIRTRYAGFDVPYHMPADYKPETDHEGLERIAEVLRNNSLAALVFFTMLRRVFNTKTGQVSMAFATLVNSTGAYPVVIGHWNLWQRICAQCYSAFNPRTKGSTDFAKRDMKLALSSFIAELHPEDLVVLGERTGATPMTETRVKSESHFVMSAYLIYGVAHALSNVLTVEQLLCPKPGIPNGWCKDQRATVYGLKMYKEFNVSSYLMVKLSQSKFTAAAHFPIGGVRNALYTDTTPSFGVEWSRAQLEELRSVVRFFSRGRVDTARHCESWFSALPAEPLRTREEILASMPIPPGETVGIPNDSYRRAVKDRNFSTTRDQENVNEILQKLNMRRAGRGRPPRHQVGRAAVTKQLLSQLHKDRHRRVINKRKALRIVGRATEMDQALLQKQRPAIAEAVVGVPVMASVATETVPVIAPLVTALVQAAQMYNSVPRRDAYTDAEAARLGL